MKSELGCFLCLFQGALVMHTSLAYTLALIVIQVWTLNGITVQSGMLMHCVEHTLVSIG